MLKLGLKLQTAEIRRSKGITCIDPNYFSDFTSSTDGWAAVEGITGFLFNQDGIGGLNDNLNIRFGPTSRGAPASMSKTLSTGFTPGCTYNYAIKYWVPSGNDEVTHMSTLSVAGVNVTIHSSAQTPDTWVEASGTFVASSSSTTVTVVFNAAHNTGTIDGAYINTIQIYL